MAGGFVCSTWLTREPATLRAVPGGHSLATSQKQNTKDKEVCQVFLMLTLVCAPALDQLLRILLADWKNREFT